MLMSRGITTVFSYDSHVALQCYQPESPEEIQELVRKFAGVNGTHNTLRVIGGGSSPQFSLLSVDQHGALLTLNKLAVSISLNEDAQTVTCTTQIRISELNAALRAKGFTLGTIPGVTAWQTVGGAIATGTHGIGMKESYLSDLLTCVYWVNGKGEKCMSEIGTKDFHCTTISLGLFGIIYKVTLRVSRDVIVEKRISLTSLNRIFEKFHSVSSSENCFLSQQLTMYSILPDSNVVFDQSCTISESSVCELTKTDRITYFLLKKIETGFANFFSIVSPNLPKKLRSFVGQGAGLFIPWFQRWLTFRGSLEDVVAINTFYPCVWDIEVAVNVNDFVAFLDETLVKVQSQNQVTIPLINVRFSNASKSVLSPAYGTCVAHTSLWFRVDENSTRNILEIMKPVVLKYHGRPHWGKIHNLHGRELKTLYPKLEDFNQFCLLHDPHKLFCNEYCAHLEVFDSPSKSVFEG